MTRFKKFQLGKDFGELTEEIEIHFLVLLYYDLFMVLYKIFFSNF